MRIVAGEGGEGSGAPKLRDRPSGAALISAFKPGVERAGGWLPIRQSWRDGDDIVAVDANGGRWIIPPSLADILPSARWLRGEGSAVSAILLPNGSSRSSARQVSADGIELIVPLPQAAAA
jgi:hypothetical protein